MTTTGQTARAPSIKNVAGVLSVHLKAVAYSLVAASRPGASTDLAMKQWERQEWTELKARRMRAKSFMSNEGVFEPSVDALISSHHRTP